MSCHSGWSASCCSRNSALYSSSAPLVKMLLSYCGKRSRSDQWAIVSLMDRFRSAFSIHQFELAWWFLFVPCTNFLFDQVGWPIPGPANFWIPSVRHLCLRGILNFWFNRRRCSSDLTNFPVSSSCLPDPGRPESLIAWICSLSPLAYSVPCVNYDNLTYGYYVTYLLQICCLSRCRNRTARRISSGPVSHRQHWKKTTSKGSTPRGPCPASPYISW